MILKEDVKARESLKDKIKSKIKSKVINTETAKKNYGNIRI